tara:strand:- start:329 stop:1057 length:729 start_codon:yes stop_codon:yes gene_type:complete
MNNKFFGTWMVSGSLFSAHLIAESDLDFGIIDLEHGHFNKNEIPMIIKVLHLAGKMACIRTSSHSANEILNVLDAGPDIIFIPSVNSVKDVKQINRNAFFAPKGKRGASGCTFANGFSKKEFNEFKINVNKNLIIGYMIETSEGLNNLLEMAEYMATNSIIYFGTYDLAESFGIENPYSKDLLEKINIVVAKIEESYPHIKYGIVANGYGKDIIPEYISYLPIFGDAGLYIRGLNSALSNYS